MLLSTPALAATLLAGVARVDITPPAGIPHMNWGAQTHVEAAGVDPVGMCATALVLSDGRQKFALVDIDTLSVGGLDEIRPRAAQATGIPVEHIRLAASHTHSGPALSPGKGPVGIDLKPFAARFAAYRRGMADKIVRAIVEANSRLAPARVSGARGTGTININRRLRPAAGRPASVGTNPEGFVDRELLVARLDDARGQPLAVLFNYPCHGTVLAWDNQRVSPDWIGMARRVVEQALPGAMCLFFQGAAGNQGPVEGFSGDLAVAYRLGAVLGHQVAALALQVETARREPRFEGFVESTAYIARQPWRETGARDATLKFVSWTLELPPRRYSPQEIEGMAKAASDAQAKVEAARAAGTPAEIHQAEARWRRCRDLLAQWKRPFDPAPVKVQVQILRLGEVAIVAMPGEPFAEIGAAVKKAPPFPVTMFCGYSSGLGGDYMPIASEYAFGGYEVERTPYGQGAAEQLIRETIALLAQVE
mgnify:CR=1 FL=1